MLTLGSLFDGSGGFPLAAKLSGIKPVWASEIEPFPIRVTTKRIPEMIHVGSITEIHGDELPPVDIITFGSPCQNLSMAGNREGLNGQKSSLFFEAIRIIKEMRNKTNGKYPRFILWENVAGAFSSNSGKDFREVLQQIFNITEDTTAIPQSETWNNSGAVLGNNCSITWRLFDAQFWGVPQRRRRIFLMADFGGGADLTRYYLSQKACMGILERCRKRGKKLPETLKKALIAQIDRS
jgi:Site-specific DNA methylase